VECKNIECNNETKNKNVYCSLKCRNIYVNKYLRNYDKVSQTIKNKELLKEQEYLKSPKKCIKCDKTISYHKRGNNYCNHSCAATDTNFKRGNFPIEWCDSISIALTEFYKDKKSKKNCKSCNIEIFGRKKYCSDDCKIKYKRKNMSAYAAYKQDAQFKFSLNSYPEEFDFSLIEKYGWYSPSNKKNNLNGVSRDHILSINDGFKLGIDTKIISHPANCQLIKHSDNISKNKRSTVTLNELLYKIEMFNYKYNIAA